MDHKNNGANNTYIPVHKTNDQVTSGYITLLRNDVSLVGGKENKKLPNIFSIHKLHKHPSIVIAAPQGSVKFLSKVVISVLKLIYKQIKT